MNRPRRSPFRIAYAYFMHDVRGIGGAAVVGALLIGGVSIVVLAISLVSGRFEAAAGALIAAAIAFVGVANVVFRQ